MDARAYHREHLERLASRPNTTVFAPEHEFTHDAWKVARLRPVLEGLAARVAAFDADVSDFAVRKQCLDDPEVLAFQRQHPKFYWLLTDRKLVRDETFRGVVAGFLQVRERVESGEVPDGHEADALATRGVMAALKPDA